MKLIFVLLLSALPYFVFAQKDIAPDWVISGSATRTPISPWSVIIYGM